MPVGPATGRNNESRSPYTKEKGAEPGDGLSLSRICHEWETHLKRISSLLLLPTGPA